MRILTISDVSIDSIAGGAERVLFEQSLRLHQRDHLVVLLTRRLPEHAENLATIKGISEYRYTLNIDNPVAFLWTSCRNSKKLIENLHAQYEFDRIVIHQPFSAMGLMFSGLNRQIKKTYVCHSLSFEEYVSRSTKPVDLVTTVINRLNIIVRKFIEKQVLKKSDKIIVLSRYTQDKLKQVYGIQRRNISIISGGSDTDRFTPALDKRSIRSSLNLPLDDTLLFTVRNLVPRMGLETLLLAFAKVLKRADGIKLIIGGEGSLKESLCALAKKLGINEQVSFTGYIPDKILPDYYRMADLFILPTKELEGFGLVTVEALASGVPVVGTPVGGTKEILGGFDQGFLFKDSTPDAMAQLIQDKVRTIQENPLRWREISLACRKYAERNYSWEQNLDAMEKLMQD